MIDKELIGKKIKAVARFKTNNEHRFDLIFEDDTVLTYRFRNGNCLKLIENKR